MKNLRRALLYTTVLAACTGCAHTGTEDLEEKTDGGHRTRNILIAVGTAIAVGAIIANQAKSKTKDAIQGAIQD